MKWLAAIVALALLLFGGCYTGPIQTYTPDGKLGYTVNCTAEGWGRCFEMAGWACGTRGYVIIDRTGETTGSAAVGVVGGSSSQTINRTMLIECR